jgi:tRNA(Ile)-lysidine synthase
MVQDRDTMRKRPGLAALELRVLRTIRKFGMLRRGEHILVAASGGADSMALLLCLDAMAALMDFRLTVAHFNHGLRGPAADEDEDFARRTAAALGLDFLTERADIKALAAATGKNLEEAAREARYAFLRRDADRVGADKIATGHNLDDQAETVLFRLLRGTGPGGLEGIHPVRDGWIIRPLLECSRPQILGYLAGRNAGFREDASNLDLRFQRNRIRHELIPYLEKHFNPRLAATLTRDASLAREAYDFLERHALAEYQRLRVLLPDGIALPARELMELHPALGHQIARHALREVLGTLRGIETVHSNGILRLCGAGQSGRRIELPGGLEARRDLERLELRRGHGSDEASFRYQLGWPGRCSVPEAGMEFVATINDGSNPAGLFGMNRRALLNPDALPPSLVIRSRLPGDRYGGAGHRKIKKMLLTSRVPLAARGSLPLVVAGDVVVWVPGFKPAKMYRSNPDTGRSVLIEARSLRDV